MEIIDTAGIDSPQAVNVCPAMDPTGENLLRPRSPASLDNLGHLIGGTNERSNPHFAPFTGPIN